MAGQEKRHRGNEGDTGKNEPHRFGMLDAFGGHEDLHEMPRIQTDDEFGEKPLQLGNSDILADVFLGRNFRHVL